MVNMGTHSDTQFQNGDTVDNTGQQGDKLTNMNNNNQNGSSTSNTKPAFERGASWGFGETKLLLILWSQDLVQRQLTNSKRTRHVWDKIAERIREHGFDRTSDQVRTRVFNMIAEYRRIMKNPTPEKRKKCIFFDAMHRIYQAKDTNNLEQLLWNEGEDSYFNYDPLDFSANNQNSNLNGNQNDQDLMLNGEDDPSRDNSDDQDDYERNELLICPVYNPSNLECNLNDFNDDSVFEEALSQNKRGRFENLNDQMLNNNNSNNGTLNNMPICPPMSLDNSASALLIDRMFTHLSKETEVMREWLNLERERLAQEVARRKEEKEREERREKSFLDVLTKFQEKVFNLLNNQQNNLNNSDNNTCQNRQCQTKMARND